MKGKRRLNENTVRRFMKLASIGSLTENFLEGDDEITEGEEEITEENDGHGPGKELKPGANVVPSSGQLKEDEELEEPTGDPEMMADMEPDMEPDAEPTGGAMTGTIDVGDFLESFKLALEKTTGLETEIDTGDLASVEAPDDAVEAEEAPARNMYEELLEDVGVDIIDEDEVVSEVVRRVAKRLVKSKLRK